MERIMYLSKILKQRRPFFHSNLLSRLQFIMEEIDRKICSSVVNIPEKLHELIPNAVLAWYFSLEGAKAEAIEKSKSYKKTALICWNQHCQDREQCVLPQSKYSKTQHYLTMITKGSQSGNNIFPRLKHYNIMIFKA